MRNKVPDDVSGLVREWADAVVKQEEAIFRGDTRGVRRHAGRITRSWKKIEALGDPALEEMCRLLEHPDPLVRIDAAVLLRHFKPDRARAVLVELAATDGRAQRALRSWDSGAWD